MANEDVSVVLSYNGEVYNFRELRSELAGQGFRFRSSGDTEVVLRAYEAWGPDCVRRLDGMFAFAVWDGRLGSLMLARDRTGKKPLYYFSQADRIAFASEIKSLLLCPWVPRRMDEQRLPEFLTFGYVPWPDTLYEGIRQLPPSSVVHFGRRGASTPQTYWSPAPRAPRINAAEASPRVAQLLTSATRRRMISDVPLGALLSGGIDSSLVVGLMSQAASEPIHTFSIGFPEDSSYDERAHARRVALHFGTRHTEFAVSVDAVSLLDRLLWHHDQPFADSSAIPTYVVSRLARDEVTVVLTGDGGDEVFAGYDRFRAAAVAPRLPRVLATSALRAAALVPRSKGYYSLRRRLERYVELAHEPLLERYLSWIAVANRDLLPELLNAQFARHDTSGSIRAQYERLESASSLDRILFANFTTYLPDDLAVKMDRMSMANSLEARSPFLDTALVEYASRIPARQKTGLRQLKPVLRRAFGPLLPDAIWRRRKHGFGVPLGSWFQGELGTLFEDEVLAHDSRCAVFLERSAVRRLWEEHHRGDVEHGTRFWTLLTLERWLRSLERPPSSAPPAGDEQLFSDAVKSRVAPTGSRYARPQHSA
jgi:asparagine synthase (glutamine-hydrolysing)